MFYLLPYVGVKFVYLLSCFWSIDFSYRSGGGSECPEAGKRFQITGDKSSRRISFNDGMAVVVFTVVLACCWKGSGSWSRKYWLLLLHEAGGALLGVLLGWVTSRLMREVMIILFPYW
jgi:CPA1 family monovalent cation:H+ antiporter